MPAILIGVAGGAGAILFRNAIELIHDPFFLGIDQIKQKFYTF